MVFRLVVDAVRRGRWAYLLAVYQIANATWMVTDQSWPLSPLAIILTGSVFLSLLSSMDLGQRIIERLPVSRRAHWVAKWWADAVIAPVIAVLSCAAVVAAADRAQLSMQGFMAWCVWATLYTGFWTAMRATPFGTMGERPVGHGTPVWQSVAVAAVLVITLAIPFFAAPYLPTTVDAFSARWSALALTMAVFTLWGYLHQPVIVARPSLRTGRKPAAYVPRHPFVDRLTGWRLKLWREVTHDLFVFAVIFVAGIVIWIWFAALQPPMPSLSEIFRRAALLPFERSTASQFEPVIFAMLFMISTISNIRLSVGLRAIRCLPLSSTQLAATPLLAGLISASTLWIALFTVHVVLSGTAPASLRLDLFLSWAACSAASTLLRTALPFGFIVNGISASMVLPALWLSTALVDPWRPEFMQPAMFVGSIALLLVVSALMFRAITRSPRLYRANPLFQGRVS